MNIRYWIECGLTFLYPLFVLLSYVSLARLSAGIYHETAVVRASVGGHTIVAHRLVI